MKIISDSFRYFPLVMLLALLLSAEMIIAQHADQKQRQTLFTRDWKFSPGDQTGANKVSFNDKDWRGLNLPHDWSIEGKFSKANPATPSGGALPGGIGWYRKTFSLSELQKDKLVFINFDGVYHNSEVWINGHYLGKRPYGYSSFRYELTPFLKFGKEKNIIAVKVDNSQQPNSRWYSGSGIYRNVWLVTTSKIYVEHWGTFVTAIVVSKTSSKVSVKIKVRNTLNEEKSVTVATEIFDNSGKKVTFVKSNVTIPAASVNETEQKLVIANPKLWDTEHPNLYKAITKIESEEKTVDQYETTFGIRSFYFDAANGFFLNGKAMKIKGVCNHHDLGFLGAAINTRAIERQIEIMKGMGVNAIRTSHNPPAPELLDLCDKMGIIVMDEAFDMWAMKKVEFDYSTNWKEWHKRDLEDMVLRDRNHPSVFIWSIGNEIPEQRDSSGIEITRELVSIIKNLDTTRPITSNMDYTKPDNFLNKSGALDLIGFSYHQYDYEAFPQNYPNQKFIGSETTSSLATRGFYDMPSDSIRRWPIRWDIPFTQGNPQQMCSAYDNCSAPWGSTNEETWKLIKKYDYLSGMFLWTGFDYLGEPTPYTWPSRSSYFGIVDLAGFPKDFYYLYQSEWTNKPVLHIFPHWNWEKGKQVDVWAYTNCDEVELFLNGKSLGIRKQQPDVFHLMWRVDYQPGTLKAVGKKDGKEILVKEIKTAGAPYKIEAVADRKKIKADATDLSFITVRILDKDGILIPNADNLIHFNVTGEGKIIGVDNGLQTSHESFQANFRHAFNGMCLGVIQSTDKQGKIKLIVKSDGLKSASIEIVSREER
ncbi:MAG: beta-galactosidase GalB [Ignavibacteria bacterium]|nr:beta-galactosidase GalB [Ignavibacteria bacterium]